MNKFVLENTSIKVLHISFFLKYSLRFFLSGASPFYNLADLSTRVRATPREELSILCNLYLAIL
jgi:hypothetical protein